MTALTMHMKDLRPRKADCSPNGEKVVGPRIIHKVVCIEVSVGELYLPWFLDTVSGDGFMIVSGCCFRS